MLPSRRRNLTAHPTAWWKESTVNSWASSGKCCPFLSCLCSVGICVCVCVCVCVRKFNLLLSHCTIFTHYSCKLFLYSCWVSFFHDNASNFRYRKRPANHLELTSIPSLHYHSPSSAGLRNLTISVQREEKFTGRSIEIYSMDFHS